MTIRGVEARDLEPCYAISLATGLAGADASHLYRDPRMMGHIYVAPYVLLEPQLAFVVEDREGIAGFSVGAEDTASWEDRLERNWWPSLRARYTDPSDVPAEQRTPDQRRAWMIHHPTRTPGAVAAAYPAHLHMNLLPRQQRRGLGAKLLDRWLEAAQRRRAQAFHVGVNRANAGAIAFWRKCGFEPLSPDALEEGRTLWMGRSWR
jgi:ribosomal protein S18 acetylase RimI-like enzyme